MADIFKVMLGSFQRSSVRLVLIDLNMKTDLSITDFPFQI